MPEFRPVEETSYLTNKASYRYIMRVFYEEYNKMNYQLYKEDIMEILQDRYPHEFADYSMDQLKQDLSALVEWKNLAPFQDPRKVYTIADYKNKQYRYSMSEASVEIERMVVRLENIFLEPANLSANYFVRLETALDKIKTLDLSKMKEVNEWWMDLQDSFLCLNQNYKDYLREFYSGRTDKILKSVEFIVHKDRFIKYLQEFIQELQYHSVKIVEKLTSLSKDEIDNLLEAVIKSEMEFPRIHMGEPDNLSEHIRSMVFGKWATFYKWFIADESHESEGNQILDITNEIIGKIIQNAALIVQLQNWGISRKSDYQHYIEMFVDCKDMDEAHCLAAHLFGVQNVRHYRLSDERSTDSIMSSTYDEEPSEYLLTPHTRKYKPRVDKTGYQGKAIEKEISRQKRLKAAEHEKKMVMKYINNNRLLVSDINDTVSESTRLILLRWISSANLSSSKTGRTEYGQEFHLKREEGYCTLHCEDGDLEMPAYVFEFD